MFGYLKDFYNRNFYVFYYIFIIFFINFYIVDDLKDSIR